MAYTDQRGMTTGRFWSIVVVVLLHIVLGYALITGLAQQAIKKVASDMKTFDVVEEAPPPEELPPPPPPDKPLPPPPVTIPPPIVTTSTPTPAPTFVPQPPPITIPPPAPNPPPPPPPPPPKPVVAARAVVRSGGAIDNSFYPSAALRNEEQGTAVASFVIGPDGRVQSCSASGASPSLNTETCRQINKWRYKPATDQSGQPIAESRTQNVRWVIPKN